VLVNDGRVGRQSVQQRVEVCQAIAVTHRVNIVDSSNSAFWTAFKVAVDRSRAWLEALRLQIAKRTEAIACQPSRLRY
jgi:hypothetical protein